MSKNYFLSQSGKEAFKSFIRAYDSHQLKTIFNLAQLDLQQVAKSFGFTQPPAVDLSKSSTHDLLSLTTNAKHFVTEMSHKFKKPERRPGNRGYGYHLNMNKEKDDNRKHFKHVPDRKQLKKFVDKAI